jgi:hypothetical protein
MSDRASHAHGHIRIIVDAPNAEAIVDGVEKHLAGLIACVKSGLYEGASLHLEIAKTPANPPVRR